MFLVGCALSDSSTNVQTTPTLPVGTSKITKFKHLPTEGSSDTINLSLIIFILDDQQQVFSSERTTAEVLKIQANANEIWSQAEIQFKVSEVRRIIVPLDLTGNIIRRQFDDFFDGIQNLEIEFDSLAPISGFYVQTVKGDNGLHPTRFNAYFIADETLNDPGRTVAHELGHILGLDHTQNDSMKLMHSGANGIILTSNEIILARKNAEMLK